MDKKFFFTVEYPGAETKKGPDLYVPEGEISLYFLRFSLFFENADYLYTEYQNATICEQTNEDIYSGISNPLGDVEVIRKEGLPLPFEKFDLVRTGLNQGYLYLINDDPEAEDAFRELEVNQSGFLSYIIEKGKRNVRYDDVRPEIDIRDDRQNVVVPKNSKYWIAYSMIQWDYNYLKEMLSNAEKRKERMQLVECKGFDATKDNSANDIKSYKYVKAAFPVGDTRIYLFEKELKRIAAYYKSSKESENQLLEEMFITLDDPMGCAFDMGIKLREEHTLHRATVESIQTGEYYFDIFQRLWKGEEETSGEVKKESKNKDHKALFNTALCLYHLLYSKASEEIGKNMRDFWIENKLEYVLAINEREYYHEKINTIRTEFCKYLNSDYFCHFLEHFMDNTYHIYLGKFYLSDLVERIAEHTQDKDRFIDLPENYQVDNDNVIEKFFQEITKEDSIYHKIFSTETPPEELEKRDSFFDSVTGMKVGRGIIRTTQKIVEGYAKHCKKIGGTEIIVKYVKKFEYKGGDYTIFPMKNNQIDIYMKMSPEVKRGSIPSSLPNGVEKNYLWIENPYSLNKTQPQLVREEIKIPSKHKHEKILSTILNNPNLRVVLASIELLNLSISATNTFKDPKLKNSVSTSGALFQLGQSIAKFYEIKLAAMGEKMNDQKKKVEYAGKYLGAAGALSNVITSFMDSYTSSQLGDKDASTAWFVAGTANTVLFLEALAGLKLGAFSTFLGANLGFLFSFWPITIVVVISFGAMFLAIYLTDSPLEKFVKNNLLGNNTLHFKPSSYFYHTYTKELIAQKNSLVKEDTAQWRDLQRAQEDLYDIVCANFIKCEPYQITYYGVDESAPWYMKSVTPAKTLVYKRLKVTITPTQFLYNVSRLFYQLYVLPQGLQETYDDDNKPFPIYSNFTKLCCEDSKEVSLNTIVIDYDIYNYVKNSMSSVLIFTTQTEIDASRGDFWPIQRGEDRYQAVLIEPFIKTNIKEELENWLGDTKRSMKSHIRIGTFKEIINPNTWQ